MTKKGKKSKKIPGLQRKAPKSLSSQDKDPLQNLLHKAIAFHQTGRLPQAEALYRQIIMNDPNQPDALNHLGLLAYQTGKADMAVELISKAINSRPDYAEAYNNLGNALRNQGKMDEAVSNFRKALALKPHFIDAYFNLGVTLQIQGRFEEAITSYRRILQLKPDYIYAYNNLGNILKAEGKLDEAVTNFRKALALKPDYVGAFKNLSAILKYKKTDNIVLEMERLYNSNKLSDIERISLGFALGKVFEDLKEYEKSSNYILEANLLKRKSYNYSIQDDQDYFERIKNVFSPSFFKTHTGSGSHDKTPIFILGMPRSGTTLVEQILASHPQVFGAGELLVLLNLTKGFGAKNGRPSFPECLKSFDRETLNKIGVNYVAEIRKHSADKKYITDKMPYNFLNIGLIKSVLPDAKVIHCTRSPMDTCFSIFKTNFTGIHRYAYDMKELGQYYKLYSGMMKYWEEVLPGFIYTIRYEKIITDQEEQTRNLLEFCDLPWDETCLSFYKTARRVNTASFAQVRKHIYNDSVTLWKRYEKQLTPLKEVLCG